MPWQSLYRRYRPQRFEELKGQDHVALALRNAVRDNRVAHAYLFSGPRGTGKTSAARILAKALNCEKPADGEPDGTCQSCVDIAGGNSLDVFELDAASNNGVDAMRDLVGRAALGTPGRWKVYIVDEVHMLSTAASNALLKTLEEPPGHVVFVLATTDPQKVLPTIRSRTQHFEFRLLGAELLAEHLRAVAADAGLTLPDGAIDAAVRRGSGSARDALSALDQIAVAGQVDDETASYEELVEALCERDVARALKAVAEAVLAGIETRQLTRGLLEELRNAFLVLMAPELVTVTGATLERITEQAQRLGPAAAVRAMELLGEVLVAMRDSPDPRILLEAALVRLSHPEADTSPAALLQRIERLERAGPAAPAAAPTLTPPAPPQPARRVPPPKAQSSAPDSGLPTRDELTMAWGDQVLGQLPAGARAIFKAGHFLAVDGNQAVFGLPNAMHRDRCEMRRSEVEDVLASHFGRAVPLRLEVLPTEVLAPPIEQQPTTAAAVTSPIDHVMEAFEGAEIVEE